MDPRHQTRYVALAAMKRCLTELRQAVEDFPFPRRDSDHEMTNACTEAVTRIEAAIKKEMEELPED